MYVQACKNVASKHDEKRQQAKICVFYKFCANSKMNERKQPNYSADESFDVAYTTKNQQQHKHTHAYMNAWMLQCMYA